MAFKKKTWVDRMVEYAGRRKITNVTTMAAQIVDVERAEGVVSEEGTAINAVNMNDLEQRTADAFSAVQQDIEGINSDLGGFSFKEEFGIKYVRGADSVWVPLGSVSSHLVTNKNTITGLVPGKECYIYVIAYWQARGIAAENKPWQLNVSGAENISVLHANYRNLYGEAGGTDAWAVLNLKSTADTITVVSLNQSINQWPMVCVVQ